MPDWGIILLIVAFVIIFAIALYFPIMYRIRAAKFKKERVIDRKITMDKPNDKHRHLLLEKAISRPFYKKYFTNLPNEYKVKTLNTSIIFNLDILESDYQNIITMLVKNSDEKYRTLIEYLIDTDLNLLLTNIFSEITNKFIIPNFDVLNEEREITNDQSDEYYAKWILDFREHTINFICDIYLPYIYEAILKLTTNKDAEKYSIGIRTIITTKYQEIIFNSLEKKFISLAEEIINDFKKIGDNISNSEAITELTTVAKKYKVDFDKIYDHNIKIEKITKMLNKIDTPQK